MSSYAKNKLQMCSVTQHQCRRRQMCGKCSHINSLHSLLDCYKKGLVFTEQSIHGFNLIRMSSYAKNKLQMCSVTQHQCRRVWKMFTNSTLIFVRSCPDWTIYSWNNSLGCPHMLRTNYRCVQSLNISVDVAKCVENVHTLIHYTHYWSVTKIRLVHWTIYSWQRFQLINVLLC